MVYSPKTLGGKHNSRNRVGIVRSYYAHLPIRKQKVPAPGGITHTQESDSDSNVSIGNGKENHHPKREFGQIDNLSLIFQLLSNVGGFFFFFFFFLELHSQGLYLSSQKQKESRCLLFTFSIKPEIRKRSV